MDTIFRLVGMITLLVFLFTPGRWSWVALLILLFAPLLALADTVPSTGQVWTSSSSGATTYSSGSAACQHLVATMNSQAGTDWPFTGVVEVISGNNYKCQYQIPATGATGFTQTVQLTSGGSCPANSTGPSGATCTCNAGYIADAGQCVQDNSDCEEKSSNGESAGGSGYIDLGTSPGSPSGNVGCSGGCETRFAGNFPVSRALVGGTYHYYGTGSMDFTGGGCVTSDTPTPDTSVPPSTCGSGQVLGTVNGQEKCLAGGTDPVNPNTGQTEPGPSSTSTTEKTTDGSGNTTTTKTSSTTNGDGSVTTKTETTECNAAGTDCTTSTTEETEGGDPLKTFCEENPKSKICTDKEGSFGGSCAGGFICEGDAIQCAIAREQHVRNCQLWAENEEASLYDSIKAGTDSGTLNNPALESNRETFSLPSTLDQSHHFTPGCWPDLTITVMSKTIVLPFSNLCPYLEYMGTILVGCALLLAAKIVVGGI